MTRDKAIADILRGAVRNLDAAKAKLPRYSDGADLEEAIGAASEAAHDIHLAIVEIEALASELDGETDERSPLAKMASEIGVSLDTLRTMTLPEWAAAKLARAN